MSAPAFQAVVSAPLPYDRNGVGFNCTRSTRLLNPDDLPGRGTSELAEAVYCVWHALDTVRTALAAGHMDRRARNWSFGLDVKLAYLAQQATPVYKDLQRVSSGDWKEAGPSAVHALHYLGRLACCRSWGTHPDRPEPVPKPGVDYEAPAVAARLRKLNWSLLPALKAGAVLELFRLSLTAHDAGPIWFVGGQA